MRSTEETDIWSAYAQLQTYKAEIPTLLHYNAALVASDGLQARMGSITANQEWFQVWRTIDVRVGEAKKDEERIAVLRGFAVLEIGEDLLAVPGAADSSVPPRLVASLRTVKSLLAAS